MNQKIHPSKTKKNKPTKQKMHKKNSEDSLKIHLMYDYKQGLWKGHDAKNTELCAQLHRVPE